MKEFTYLLPKSIGELCQLLEEHGVNAKILAGGTDLLIRMKEKIWQPEYVIDLKRIEELNEIVSDDIGITIGAGVTISKVISCTDIQEKYPFFIEALELLGSVQVRNRATIIGNLCNASPLADSAPSLLVLAAKMRIVSSDGERWIPLEEFFTGPGMTSLKVGEFVASVHIPASCGEGIYFKHSRRKEVDLASVSVACYQSEDNFRIAMGAVAPTPVRTYLAEKYLDEKGLSVNTLETVVDLAVKAVKPITDIRATEEYRKEMVEVLTRRALKHFL